MRKLLIFLMAAALTVGCQKDDTDFSDFINGSSTPPSGSSSNAISIVYSGTSVTVTGDTKGYVTTDGAHVTVNTGTATDSLLLVLSGSTTDGSLLVYRQAKFGIQLNGVSIHHANGPAINNQCGKALYLHVTGGTNNTLTDGTTYTEQTFDQKGALFSEGEIFFLGTGELNVTGNCTINEHSVYADPKIYNPGDKASVFTISELSFKSCRALCILSSVSTDLLIFFCFTASFSFAHLKPDFMP